VKKNIKPKTGSVSGSGAPRFFSHALRVSGQKKEKIQKNKEELAPRQSKQTTNGPIPNDQKTERSDRPTH